MCRNMIGRAAILVVLVLTSGSLWLIAQSSSFHAVGTRYQTAHLSRSGLSTIVPGIGDELYSTVHTILPNGTVDSRMVRWCEILDVDANRGWLAVIDIIDDQTTILSYRAHTSSATSNDGLYVVRGTEALRIERTVSDSIFLEYVSVSGDGHHIVYSLHDEVSGTYHMKHCDLRTMQNSELYRQTSEITGMQISFDGNVLFFYDKGAYWTYTIETGQTTNMWIVRDEEDLSYPLALSPDGKWAWGAAYRRVGDNMRLVITRYDVKTGAGNDYATVPLPMPQQGSGDKVFPSPDGTKLAIDFSSGNSSDSIAVMDITTKSFTFPRLGKDMIRWIGWMSDSRHLCFVSWSETCIADITAEHDVKILQSYLSPSLIVADPSGRHVTILDHSGWGGSTIDLSHSTQVNAVDWSLSSTYYSDYTKQIYIARRSQGGRNLIERSNIIGTTTESLGTVPADYGDIIGVDGSGVRMMFVNDSAKTLTVYDLTEQRVLVRVTAQEENDYRAGIGQITADGRLGAFLGYYSKTLWDLDRGEEVPLPSQYNEESFSSPCLPMSSDGRYLTSSRGRGVPITVYDRTTDLISTVSFDHRGFVSFTSFSGDGRYFLAIGQFGTVGVFSTTTWSLVDHFELGNCDEELGDMRSPIVSWHPETGVYAVLPQTFQHNVWVMQRQPTTVTEHASTLNTHDPISVTTPRTTTRFSLPGMHVQSVAAYTLLGSSVEISWSAPNPSEIQVNASSLNSGVYLLHVFDDQQNRKVVKLLVE